MKAARPPQIIFLNPRVLIGFALYAIGLVLALAPMSSAIARDNPAAELSQSVPAHAPVRWRATGDLVTARELHRATLLPNGRVLVASGTSAELYDPATGVWTPTGSLSIYRILHTATLLPNGKVLVAGGFGGAFSLTSAELYDPATGAWTATGSMNVGRDSHTATLLPNGQVLVAGGYGGGTNYLASAEVYDPAAGVFDIQ